MAQTLRPLEDNDLAQVSGGDGVGFAMHLVLNDPALPGAMQNRLVRGFTDANGQTTYLVIQNLNGKIDMVGLGLDIEKSPDGTNYTALTFPHHVRFTNFGFDAIGAQTDPLGPVTGSLGSIYANGNLTMEGQLRFWAH